MDWPGIRQLMRLRNNRCSSSDPLVFAGVSFAWTDQLQLPAYRACRLLALPEKKRTIQKIFEQLPKESCQNTRSQDPDHFQPVPSTPAHRPECLIPVGVGSWCGLTPPDSKVSMPCICRGLGFRAFGQRQAHMSAIFHSLELVVGVSSATWTPYLKFR